MNYYRTPFTLMTDLMSLQQDGNYYVVSDSMYKQLRKEQALEEISTLQKRLEHYEQAADRLRKVISELKEEHGLSESSDDSSAP